MQDGVQAEEGRTLDDAIHQMHNALGVPRWRVVRDQQVSAPERDPLAPLWWDDEEEASSSFLNAMGVGI